MTLELLKKKIQEAVPSIGNQPCTHYIMADENGCPFGEHNREIRLADVMLALKHHIEYLKFDVTTGGELWAEDGEEGNRLFWNLNDDNLDHQSPECIQFLCDLLK